MGSDTKLPVLLHMEPEGRAGWIRREQGSPAVLPAGRKPLSAQQSNLQYILYIYYNCTSSRHLQLYSQPRERAHARQENTEVFLQSICSSWLPPRQETETVKEEDWNFSLMCWLVRGAAAGGSRVSGSRGPTGAAGLGHWGNPPLLAWVRMFSGDSPKSQEDWGVQRPG